MPLIIDGWNLIRNESSDIPDDGSGDSLESAKKLIMCLKDYQLTHSDPIILVFDSARRFLDIDYKNSSKLTVVPAASADDYIKRYIDKTPEKQRRNLRVVTSDNSVYYYSRSLAAAVIRSEEFWDKIYSDRRRRNPERV